MQRLEKARRHIFLKFKALRPIKDTPRVAREPGESPALIRIKASGLTQESSCFHCLALGRTISLANSVTGAAEEWGQEKEAGPGGETHLDAISLVRVNRTDRSARRQPGTG